MQRGMGGIIPFSLPLKQMFIWLVSQKLQWEGEGVGKNQRLVP